MTGDQLSALMLQAIETEAAKPAKEINDAWLTACSELMASADQDKPAKLSDHAERIRSKLVEAIRKDQKVQQRRLAYRMATAAACFLIIFAGVSFSKKWFRATQSPDEQVYNLLGQQVEIQTGNQAAADGDEAWRECETTSFQELCDFLGYVPQIPTWVPNGWVLNRYYASIDGESRSITAVAARNPKQKWREFQNNGICSKYTKSGPGRSTPGPLSYVLSSIPSRCAAALAIVMCASIPTASKPSSAAAASVVPLPASGSRILPPGTHICTT